MPMTRRWHRPWPSARSCSERPVLDTGTRAVIGRPPEIILALL
jgi:arsenate reductase-like glutaredoxin family protein